MNRKNIQVIAVLAILTLGAVGLGAWYVLRSGAGQPASQTAATSKERKVLYWTDPMTPGYRSDKPGKSPFMDMELVPVYEDAREGARTAGTPAVTIRPEIINSLGVRTYKVTRATQTRSLTAQGYVFRENQRLSVLVDIFERAMVWVRPGLPAEVRVPDLPGQRWTGTLDAVESDIDIGSRTIKARVRIHNARGAIAPNMFAEVTIKGPAGGPALLVPNEALIRTGARTALVLALGDGRFQPVEVVPGAESGDWIEIRQGIRDGDVVVVSGQFLIDSEASVRASLSRMQTTGEPPAAGKAVTPPDKSPANAEHKGH